MSEPFEATNVRAFVDAWFSMLDRHDPADMVLAFADDDARMHFPEKTLEGVGDLRAWYEGGTYHDGEAAPGVINIFFDEVHQLVDLDVEVHASTCTLNLVVAWQASMFIPPEASSRRVALDATQRWELRAGPERRNHYGLLITSYDAVAAPFVYAPGFARL